MYCGFSVILLSMQWSCRVDPLLMIFSFEPPIMEMASVTDFMEQVERKDTAKIAPFHDRLALKRPPPFFLLTTLVVLRLPSRFPLRHCIAPARVREAIAKAILMIRGPEREEGGLYVLHTLRTELRPSLSRPATLRNPAFDFRGRLEE